LELSTLAKRYALELESPADLCFERRVEQLDRTRVLEAMRATLAIPDARIEIVETSLFPVPHGKLEFRREGLRRPALPSARTPVEWRGNVVYDDNRRFAIWARVIVSVNCTRVVAVENLKSGELITAGNVRLESLETFPLAAGVAQTIEEVVGRISWRAIAQGSEIQVTQLRLPPDVNRGDLVEVEVRSGGARLSFTATAESAGRSGEVIAMRNPSSNKVFRARLNGKGHALLEADRPMVN
jgi:flagella basal body P-ring formation protein FlgA